MYKYKYTPDTFNVLVKFMTAGFNIFHICLKKNINIQLVLLKKRFIYKFYYQLYFLITKFLQFKKAFSLHYQQLMLYLVKTPVYNK